MGEELELKGLLIKIQKLLRNVESTKVSDKDSQLQETKKKIEDAKYYMNNLEKNTERKTEYSNYRRILEEFLAQYKGFVRIIKNYDVSPFDSSIFQPKTTPNLNAFNSNDLQQVKKEREQISKHFCRLIGKSNEKIKYMEEGANKITTTLLKRDTKWMVKLENNFKKTKFAEQRNCRISYK